MIHIELADFDIKEFTRALPTELIEDTKFYIENNKGEKVIEFVVIVGENKDIVKASAASVGAVFEDLGFGFGIISIQSGDFMKIQDIKGIQYVELPKVFITNDLQNNAISCIPQVWQNYGLSGKGVLIGFIDTGIDFRHPVFIGKDNKTRIKYIYDLANQKIYNEQKINEALASSDPGAIVPTVDFIGHGTAIASVAAGGGKVPIDNYGVAYEASIIMVKTTGDGDFKSALSTQILRGLKFLIDKSIELNMPLVVNISLSTNDGSHNGTSLVEKYVSEYSQIQKVCVVIAAGNEGAAGHHYSAKMEVENEIFINISEGEQKITLQMYKPLLTDISIELIAPDGKTTGLLRIRLGTRRKEDENHKFVIYYSGPKPFDSGGEISINIIAKNKMIVFGQWSLKIYNPTDYTGIFDIWLPVSEALNPSTKFLQPDPFNTLGIPATVDQVIAVGSYNANANNYSYFSGRGVERVNWIVKPDILAPGENINAAMVGGFFGPETGTSIAAPQVAGSCALLIEWGLVKGNAPFLVGEKIKYYLAKGARRATKLGVYPSKNVGFGYLCLAGALAAAVKDKQDIDNSEDELNGREGAEKLRIEEKNTNNMSNNQQNDMINNLQSNMSDKPPSNTINNLQSNISDNSQGNMIDNSQNNMSETLQYLQKKKVFIQNTTQKFYLNDEYLDFLVQYDGDIINVIEKLGDAASAFTIDDSYAIISAKPEYINDIINLKEIVYVDSGGVYTLQDFKKQNLRPAESSNAINIEYNPYFNLTGKGIMIGIIDTGVDYLNQEFIRADNTTNIYRIWDQSLPPTTSTGTDIGVGIEYTEEEINKALNFKAQGKDPYTVVESKDENGHGTAMAALIAGRGIGSSIKGIAMDAKIAMVKIKSASEEFRKLYASDNEMNYQFRNTDIMIGIKYLSDISKAAKKPMVIYIPLGTTIGGHDGTSIIERYMDNLSDSNGIVFVTSTGNEGAGENHTSGKINKVGDRASIELQIGDNEKDIFMIIYCKAPDKMELSVSSPSSDLFENINPKVKSGVDLYFVLEDTRMSIMFIDPSELTGDPVMVIKATGLKPGIWVFTLIGQYVVNGTYDFWLLQRELLDPNTKFLMPTPDTTLTIPSTAYSVICVGSYNQQNDSVLVTSGRGLTRKGRQAPILVAGGYNAKVAAPGNTTTIRSGGSVAGAVIAGCCCQLLQWGIVNGHDTTMNATKLRTYLMRGTRQRRGDVYPNPQFGYGIIDMNILFDSLKGYPGGNSKTGTSIKPTRNMCEIENEDIEINENEIYHKGLFIRLAKNNHS